MGGSRGGGGGGRGLGHPLENYVAIEILVRNPLEKQLDPLVLEGGSLVQPSVKYVD